MVMMQFLNRKHKIRFAALMARACKFLSDVRTSALFYVIAGNDLLYSRVDAIYDFYVGVADERVLYNKLEIIPMYTVDWWLLEYAFSLYFETYPVDAQLLFANVVTDNQMFLITESAKIRYNSTHA